MAAEDRSLSEFPRALSVLSTALIMISNPDGLGGFDTEAALLTEVGKALLGVQYVSELGSVSVFDAIKNCRVLSGTTTPTSEGADGQLYIKYENVGGVDSVVGIYFKLSGTWLEIPTSGGGGSSTLSGLTDVDITTPTDGELLGYNAVSQKWENVSGGGGITIHEMTYTGTGTNSHDITFTQKPQIILAWDGLGLFSYYALLSSFRYGSTFSPITYYDGNTGGMLYDSLSYSDDELTLTISGSDAGAAMNASGNTYHLLWI